MFCIYCGKEIPDDTNFCCYCGANLKEEVISPQNPTQEKNEDYCWYYVDIDNQKWGPFSDTEIRNKVMNGKIKRDTLVWRTGLNDWMQAGQTELAELFSYKQPALPLYIINDKWLWALATVPTIAIWLLVAMGVTDRSALIAIRLILNCVFLALDLKEVRKATGKVDHCLYLGFILVPVYMFLRIGMTTKKYAPAIVWCVIEFIDFFI